MIIADDTPLSPAKTNASLPLNSPAVGDEQQPPPAYGATQRSLPYSQAQLQPSVVAGPSSQPHIPFSSAARRRKSSVWRRFCGALGVALLIWILFTIFVSSFSLNEGDYRKRKSWYTNYPIPSNVIVSECIEGPKMSNYSFPYSYVKGAETSFELPLSSDTLFLLSRGMLIRGAMRIASSSEVTDAARVNVKAIYSHEDALSKSMVCLLKRGRKQDGVGVFSSRWGSDSNPLETLQYEITVTLPEPRGPSLLQLNAFETDLPNFHHMLPSLDETVHFKSLFLSSTNSIVTAESVTAENGRIHTTNGAVEIKSLTVKEGSIYAKNSNIKGHYTASGSLELRATNEPIRAEVDLHSSNGKGELSLLTTNKYIDAKVNLLGSKDDVYTVLAKTTNALVDLKIEELPIESKLKLDAISTNKKVSTRLPASYEGSYSLTTTNAGPSVYIENTEDPTGRRRKRQSRRASVYRSYLNNTIYWDKKNELLSEVNLKTSNDDVSLYL